MPAGSAIMMFAGPFMAPYGWPLMWQVNAALAALYAVVIWLAIPLDADDHAAADRGLLSKVGQVLTSPGPVLLSVAFALYTFQYGAMTGLMPTLLVERAGLTIAQAGTLSAVTVVANMIGNLSTGIFVKLKIPTWAVMASAFGFLGLASFGVFSDALPVGVVIVLACASLAITGLVPASIFAASPRVAHPALLALTLGLLVQASNIGQLLGPAALGGVVHHFGWNSAPMVFGAVAATGIAVALGLRRLLKPV
jgi:predicted MFS family arabinose efflux permease